MGKLYESVIRNRLCNFMNNNNIIRKEQFGFKRSHNTNLQIPHFTEYITDNLINNTAVVAILLDLQNVSYTVWSNGLLFRIIITNTLD